METTASTSTQHVYFFGEGRADGGAAMRDLLGGKGANLAEMTNLGVPVPPGFTISTEVCRAFIRKGGAYPDGLREQVDKAIARVERIMGARFGDAAHPLLVSVRSGSRASMPGMMDTVLNLGLNDRTVEGLIARTGDQRYAYDCYRRLIQMYADVVMGLKDHVLEHLLHDYKNEKGVRLDLELRAEDWRHLIARFQETVQRELGRAVPQDPSEQLWGAIDAVFRSWNAPRAVRYRRIHNIPDDWGTAVNVQAMVFGNMGETSASGVAFTRSPATGEAGAYGEFLINSQGEDVVAGIRTPAPLDERCRPPGSDEPSLEQRMPATYEELLRVFELLEDHYRDMQDIEFTVEQGKLWILQTRTGKRTGQAAVRIALELLDQRRITEEEALLRLDPSRHVEELLHPRIDPQAEAPAPLTRGLAASPGAASGEVVLCADEAAAAARAGRAVLLVREETVAEDIHGMHAAQGILTATGGLTSHAAVVARSMGRPCIAGAGALVIARDGSGFRIGERRFSPGDVLTIDGTTGEVFEGALPLMQPGISGGLERILSLADRHRRLAVRANADTPADAERARGFGAEGIGLCRTEHMFFQPEERVATVRAMILAESDAERDRALARLLPMQRDDFLGILRAMDGLPVTVRLLDPPLHEFLPRHPEEVAALARALGRPADEVQARIDGLHEQNPMLGHRGCRLGVTFPAIYLMQVDALAQAAIGLRREGLDPRVEVMVPLVADAAELRLLGAQIRERIDQRIREAGITLPYLVGTMIELPRAALTADEIAAEAEFFSFGTNDLTQCAYGLSRDDAGRFLPHYLDHDLLKADPFATLDQRGVGELVRTGVERGRRARSELHIGICGEHGGDPDSVEFFHRAGLDYVSCSPFRVPVARLAAAQAALREGRER